MFDWVSMKGDGTMFETNITLTALDIDGERRVLAVIKDVTEQNRANARSRGLLPTRR